jgi:hypothetical protein
VECLFVAILFVVVVLLAIIRAWRKEGYSGAARAMIDVSRTPIGMMGLADWNDPDDPFAVALDLGVDPATGEPWDGEPYEDPYFYDGDGL